MPVENIQITLTPKSFEERIEAIFKRQAEFQRMAEVVDVTDMSQAEVARCTETFLYKAIEELVEARRTFPSSLNRWEKERRPMDRKRLKMELCDSLLFHINVCVVNGFTPGDILETLFAIQYVNFETLKGKLRERAESYEPEGEGSPVRRLQAGDLQRAGEGVPGHDTGPTAGGRDDDADTH